MRSCTIAGCLYIWILATRSVAPVNSTKCAEFIHQIFHRCESYEAILCEKIDSTADPDKTLPILTAGRNIDLPDNFFNVLFGNGAFRNITNLDQRYETERSLYFLQHATIKCPDAGLGCDMEDVSLCWRCHQKESSMQGTSLGKSCKVEGPSSHGRPARAVSIVINQIVWVMEKHTSSNRLLSVAGMMLSTRSLGGRLALESCYPM